MAVTIHREADREGRDKHRRRAEEEDNDHVQVVERSSGQPRRTTSPVSAPPKYSFLLPPPTQRSARPSSSSSSKRATASSSSSAWANASAGFHVSATSQGSSSHSSRRESRPVGVPRPPTARSSRRSSASSLSGSSQSQPLQPTQPRSRAPSTTPKASEKRSTTPSPSPPPVHLPLSFPTPKPPASTTPRSSNSKARATSSKKPNYKAKPLGPVPIPPSSSFDIPSTTPPSALPPTSSTFPPPSRPTSLVANPSPPRPPSPTLLRSLTSTDWTALDPSNRYALSSSLLFRVEHLQLGSLTYQQAGGTVKYGATAKGKGKERADVELASPPRWAKTPDGREWEEDVLRRLGSRLLSGSAHAGIGDDFVAVLWARDLQRLRRVRLGQGGGIECYLVEGGRGEFPCRKVVVVGWVVEREWKDREGGWVYTVDDGTALLKVSCPCTVDSSSTSLPFPSLSPTPLLPSHFIPAPAPSSSTSTLPRTPKKRPYADLEHRAQEHASEKVVLGVGKLVRVVGRVEEPRGVWESERRVVADRVELLSSLSAEPEHHLLVASLHADVYSQPFDVRARLAAIEREEAETQQREWETRSEMSSVAGSDWGGAVSSVGGSSPGGRTRYRPTRPSKLNPEDLTLSNFIIYIRHHLLRHYVRAVPSSPSPPSSSSFSSATHTAEFALPFTLTSLTQNRHLALFARRLAQEKHKLKAHKEAEQRKRARLEGHLAVAVGATREGDKAWVAPPRTGARGAVKAKRGAVGKGSGKLVMMLPPPRSSAFSAANRATETKEERRARREKEKADEEGALVGEELEVAVEECWKEALRTMRKGGMVVEWVPPPEEEDQGIEEEEDDDEEELPDLPSWGKGPETPTKKRGVASKIKITEESPPKIKRKEESPPAELSNCPWGEPRLFLSQSSDGVDAHTPVKRSRSHCPWDLQLDSSQPDRTPQAAKKRRGDEEDETPRAGRPARVKKEPPRFDASFGGGGGGNTSFASTDRGGNTSTSSSVASSFDYDTSSFQLVTAGSLAPSILALLRTLYSSAASNRDRTGASSVSENDVRAAMHLDDRWSAVARFSEVVGKALEVLGERGEAERYGRGWRPVEMGQGW
ncbi:hypothetical protein JCM1840_006653 [Sporobolomyces johnsonii]